MVTVPSTPRVNTITLASASAGPFEVGFRLFEAAAVEIYVNGDLVSSGYTVTANFNDGYDDAATILFDEALEAADVIVVFGKMTPQRGNDYGAVEPKLTAKLNLELGKIWAVLSEHRHGLDRALRGFNEAPIGDLEAEKAIYWSGTEFVAGPSLANIAAAQANAEAALQAAQDAAESAEEAATFDPSLFLTKAGNLAGVADTDTALATLGGGVSGIAVFKLATQGAIRSYLSLGSAAQQPFTDNVDLAVNPSHVGSRGNVAAYVAARDITDPHLIVSTSDTGNTSLSAGSEYQVPFNDVLHQDADIVPGIQLFSGDLVYVPAGIYYAEWESAFFRNSGSNTGRFLTTLRDKTAGVDLGYGARGACSAYEHGSGHGRARFTLVATSTVGLVVDVASYSLELEAVDPNFARPARNRFLRLWKVA
ncbi:hypothetical protein [Oceanicola sp. S124]|uniref:hypothetical protein n=1 Tax=Oceanicola sp. S124 TaxID=1042378 RepID=UPI000255A968|nr:hypothetical protein [Oceanicola sp. S124]